MHGKFAAFGRNASLRVPHRSLPMTSRCSLAGPGLFSRWYSIAGSIPTSGPGLRQSILHGKNFIGGSLSSSVEEDTQERFKSVDPSTGLPMDHPVFVSASSRLVNEAVELAHHARGAFSRVPLSERAHLLCRIGDFLRTNEHIIIDIASGETGLDATPRLEGELTRTIDQLNMFAQMISDESERGWMGQAQSTTPSGTIIRKISVPLGPVAIFGASNFPIAFSVAGGDTASALAAGCPVIAKAHPAHPGTCEVVARSIRRAVDDCGMPDGVFSMVHGGATVGNLLVTHPKISGVAFTGSKAVGRKLFNQAAARRVPIPVFAEMGSVNPIVVTPSTLRSRMKEFVSGLVASFTRDSGQYCTNPGLVFVLSDSQGQQRAFEKALEVEISSNTSMCGPMLSSSMHAAYKDGIKKAIKGGLRTLTADPPQKGVNIPPRVVFKTTGNEFYENYATHQEECFGPCTTVVHCTSPSELSRALSRLHGQLTASIHGTSVDWTDPFILRTVFPRLAELAGRVIVNEFPTGVHVCDAMVHGGPYPASSDSRSTSVGTHAIDRWLRPVAFQNVPLELSSQYYHEGEQLNGDKNA